MRSTIAKPDVLRLLIPDMADSIIHRFANSSNIRAGATIAASQPLRHGSRPRRIRVYYWFRVGVPSFTHAYLRTYSLDAFVRGCAHLQMRTRVNPSGATESNETAFNLPIDDDFVRMLAFSRSHSLLHSRSSSRSVLPQYSRNCYQLSRITETAGFAASGNIYTSFRSFSCE